MHASDPRDGDSLAAPNTVPRVWLDYEHAESVGDQEHPAVMRGVYVCSDAKAGRASARHDHDVVPVAVNVIERRPIPERGEPRNVGTGLGPDKPAAGNVDQTPAPAAVDRENASLELSRQRMQLLEGGCPLHGRRSRSHVRRNESCVGRSREPTGTLCKIATEAAKTLSDREPGCEQCARSLHRGLDAYIRVARARRCRDDAVPNPQQRPAQHEHYPVRANGDRRVERHCPATDERHFPAQPPRGSTRERIPCRILLEGAEHIANVRERSIDTALQGKPHTTIIVRPGNKYAPGTLWFRDFLNALRARRVGGVQRTSRER